MTTTLAVISGSALGGVILKIIVAGLIFWLIDWAIGAIGLPEPFGKVARVILILAVVIYLIDTLLSLTGNSFIRW